MSESAVLLALKTIGNLLIEEGKFLHGLKDEVLQLQRELKWMKLFLEDADENMIDDKRTIQECILEVKDVAYDAGYLLEDYAFKVGSRTMDGGFLEILSRSACIFNDSYLRHKIRSEIQALNTRILNLKNNFQAYGLSDIMEKEGSSSRKQLLRRTYSFVEEEDFVGLQDDVDLLVKYLVSEDVRVVSIWGMGGLGKTTLANKVYKHPIVKRYFNRFAWICVSQQWQTKDILQRIMIKLLPENKDEIEKLREDELIPKLFKVQQECKCLIVLDDIWTEEAWESIKNAFPSNERGSKILLTTRTREVAMHIRPNGFHHQPRLLSDDESWDLLKRKALPEGYDEGDCNNTQLNEVEELGKKMVKYCGGLPLAVVVLGGILLANNTLNGWAKVNEDIKSYLWKKKGIGKGKGELERILALSYYDLPFQLKPCFLYLSVFPEDTDIDAETLCQMWIAEGMVLTEDLVGEESMMELAERYLGELGQRGMVQFGTLTPGAWGYYDDIRYRRSCRLHDLMRDLCLRKAEEESFLKCINYSSEQKDPCGSVYESSTCKLRRLVINLDCSDLSIYVPPKKEITKYVRMLQFVINGEYDGRVPKSIKSQLNNFEMLHVLSIEGQGSPHYIWGWKVPKAIGKLIHLRYLSLKGSHCHTLPSSMENLKHLQTLNLRVQRQLRVPNILWKMKELTCLYLPFGLQRYKRVRLDGLNELEILGNFDDEHCYTEDLLKLNNLRVLTIVQCVEFENLEMIANYAESSNKLQQLSIKGIQCDLYSEKEKGLRVLKQLLFGRNIHYLGIWGQLWKFPKFESNMSSSLVRLDISCGGLDAEEVISGTLEKLTHLRILWLDNLRGKEMVFHAMGFPQLRELYLSYFEDLEKWVVEEGAMPNLRTLTLDYFPKLEEIPDGLQFVVSLEELRITNISKKFIEMIQITNKISHVSSIIIDNY